MFRLINFDTNLMLQETHQSGLGEKCLLQIATATMDSQEFIDVLAKLGRGFCYHLMKDIISPIMQDQIYRASDDADALHLIRVVNPHTLVFLAQYTYILRNKMNHVLNAYNVNLMKYVQEFQLYRFENGQNGTFWISFKFYLFDK